MPFPIGELNNFVFCGIATVAATVGYAFTRKQTPIVTPFALSSETIVASSSSASEGKQSEIAPQRAGEIPHHSHGMEARRGSLKRKEPHDGFDEPTPDDGYPNNLRHIYPYKRSRTPSSRSDKETHSMDPNDIPVEARSEQQPSPQPSVPGTDTEIDTTREAVTHEVNDESDVPNVNSPVIEPPRTPSPIAVAVLEASAVFTQPLASAFTPKSEPPNAFTPSRPTTPAPKPLSSSSFGSTAFAAFAGSTSPFASIKKTPRSSFRASLWNADSQEGSSADASTSKNSLLPPLGEPEETETSLAFDSDSHAISAAAPSQAAKSSTHTTGEEEEDVEQEIKGVKLFVKRGNKAFTSGMVGHLKLLSNKTTLAERLLFRREPLWQVSMNVRVNASTRCVYDPEENAIRLLLKEPVAEASAPNSVSLEVVVYALKPGRACSKQDFKEFAETLVNNAQFKNAVAEK